MTLSSLDLVYLTKELQVLVGARVQKVYHDPRDKFLFEFHKTGVGKLLFKAHLPSTAYLSNHKESYPTPGGFCQVLRKYFKGKITAVEQLGFDRIIKFSIEDLSLYIELFAKGNMILTKEEKIMSLLQTQNWASRTLRGGIPYTPPPVTLDPRALTEEKLSEILTKSTHPGIAVTLAKNVGLGGVYAEEACKRAKQESKSKPATANTKALLKAIHSLFEENLMPNSDGEGAYPFKLQTRKPKKTFKTFSEAFDAVSAKQTTIIPEDKQLIKLQAVLEQQTAMKHQFEEESQHFQRIGELLYEHYQDVKTALEVAKKDKKQKVELDL